MSQVYLINQGTFAGYQDLSVNIDAKRIPPCVKLAQDLDLKLFMGAAFWCDFIPYVSNDGFLTADITTNTTTAANGTYTNKAIVSGAGTNGKATFKVLDGNVTSIVQTDPGVGFSIGDTFTCVDVPGALFTVATLSPDAVFAADTPQPYLDLFNGKTYQDLNGHAIIYDGIIPALLYWTFARFIEVDQVRYTATGPVQKRHNEADPISDKTITKLVAMQRSVANAHANNIEMFLTNNKSLFPLWRFNQQNKSSRQPGPRIRGVDKTAYNRAGYGTGNYNGYNEFL